MKTHILTIAFCFSLVNLTAQSKNQISNWLYDLPINKDAIALKKAIHRDENFEESDRSKSNNFKNSSSMYWGTILKPLLPNPGRLDSSKINLTIGVLNSTDGYSGGMKWLRFEYFSIDTIFLNQLYESACRDFGSNAKQEKNTGFRKNNEVVGEGNKYIYINDVDELRSISILRVRYVNGIQSFSIHYSGSNELKLLTLTNMHNKKQRPR